VHEGDVINPSTAFIAAKHALHSVGNELAKENGMEFIWIRPFYIYGPRQRSASLIPSIISSARNRTPIKLKTPLARNDFIYVDDVARGIADAVAKGKNGSTYNLGSGTLTPLKKIAELIYTELDAADAYDKTLFKGRPAGGFYADLSKSKRELGWRPKITIAEGIRKTIHYEDHHNGIRKLRR
jgi:nucleoside-diphosphate-sugar epimerase